MGLLLDIFYTHPLCLTFTGKSNTRVGRRETRTLDRHMGTLCQKCFRLFFFLKKIYY